MTLGAVVWNRRSAQVFSAVSGALFAAALLFSSGDALAQDRRGQPLRTVPQAEAPNPLIDAASPFGAALSACDKGQEEDNHYALPGAKGEIVLDRCYRGRRQLACRFEAISTEGKSLMDEFTRIVEEHYPEIGNVEGICKISFESLAKDFAGTAEFNKRFGAARSEYDARTTCANKVKQSVQELALADLAQGSEVQKSMVEALDQEINKVSAVQEQVAGLAGKLQASQKAIAVLQRIHRAMCLNSTPTPAPSQSSVQPGQ
jgi:hypothetical protein